MRKPREDSTWNQLTAEQQDTLEEWLLDENLAYAEVLGRVKQDMFP